MIEQIPDYSVLVEKLMEQWKNSPNLVGIIEGSMVQANKMEDAIFEVRDLTNLDVATGINLDVLGKPWNELRESKSDADYRIAIQEKKLLSFSGEPEVIISILKGTYAGTFVNYSPEYPGKYRVKTDATIPFNSLQEISMAGVQGFLAGNIIDQAGNFIVDEQGNNIIHVSSTARVNITAASGVDLEGVGGASIETVGFY